MNDQLFDIYRRASQSWFKMQQELFEGFYESAIHLFRRTSEVPAPKSPEDGPRIADTNRSKTPKVPRKSTSGTARHSRKATGRRPGH